MKFHILMIVGLLISGSAIAAENLSAFKGIKSVKVILTDEVDGGCWQNTKSAKIFVEKEFLSSGIKVKQKSADVTFEIYAIGFPVRVKGRQAGCAAYYKVSVWKVLFVKPNYSKVGFFSTIDIFLETRLTIQSDKDLTSRLNDDFKRFAAEFAVKVLKANQAP